VVVLRCTCTRKVLEAVETENCCMFFKVRMRPLSLSCMLVLSHRSQLQQSVLVSKLLLLKDGSMQGTSAPNAAAAAELSLHKPRWYKAPIIAVRHKTLKIVARQLA